MSSPEANLERAQRLASRIKRLGYVILFAGLAISLALYFLIGPGSHHNTAGHDNTVDGTFLVQGTDSARYQYQVERMGGKSMLLMDQLNDWFDSLLQPDRLPYTLAVLSALAALAAFLVADMIALDVHEKPGRDQD